MNKKIAVTILLCEDDEVIRDLYRKILELRGYRIIVAVDGNDAIEKFILHKDEIRLLVSDVMMPNKNGRQAYDEIRKVDSKVKVIFNSGFNSDAINSLREEGFHYLQKPYAPQLLLDKIREVLADDFSLRVNSW
jgi:DNA-binding NtrC family response regulator